MSKQRFAARRDRRTRRSVVVVERLARVLITAGGIGTILAVGLICVFLVGVTLPLFLPTEIEEQRALPAAGLDAPVLEARVDDAGLLSWTLAADGAFEARRLDTGELLSRAEVFGEPVPTAAAFTIGSDLAAFGFADGAIRLARVGFASRILRPEDEAELAPELQALAPGEHAAAGDAVFERTGADQLRRTAASFEWEDGFEAQAASPVVALDLSLPASGIAMASLHADGSLFVYGVRERTNMLTGERERRLSAKPVPRGAAARSDVPRYLLLSGLGNDLYLAWSDGSLAHFDMRGASPRLLEELDLVPGDGHLTLLSWVNGKTTLLAGDSSGALSGWFPVEDLATYERLLRRAIELPGLGAAPLAHGPSSRSRLSVVGFADGQVGLYQVSTARLLERAALEAGPVELVAFAPKEDGILARGPAAAAFWRVERRHPEASLAALFAPVWYEGYQRAEHVWQSSSGSDATEPKLGLWPLVFGTIKATVYSMLFGAPLAILAALFTSEFLAPRLRNPIKSTVELMASLPSVVLGFLAGLVVAPFVQDVLPAVLAAMLALPFTLLLCAHLWQVLPAQLAIRFSGWPRFALMALALPLAVLAAVLLGPALERVVFAGDLYRWLDGQVGGAWGGWFYLLLPLSAVVVVACSARLLDGRLRERMAGWERGRVARASLLKFLLSSLAAVGLAAAAALALELLGLDVRGGVFGTYESRNSLIVGFVMGFAIIPIIYTLSEDALSEVPGHLREGSLGAGATHWQTALRIVVPTAMSGLFSALMIGLGRAVGETMIVLMAVGSTPIMEWNVFNGFRTLSANIATELPEAVVGSAHYRTLFLAALVLFAMTFLLNTIAEAVRRHFRKKTHAL